MTVNDLQWKDLDTIRVVDSDTGPRLTSPVVPVAGGSDSTFPVLDLLVKGSNGNLTRLRRLAAGEYPLLRVRGNSPYLHTPRAIAASRKSAKGEVSAPWPDDVPDLAGAPVFHREEG